MLFGILDMIRNKILEILNDRGEIELKDLILLVNEHPRVVRKVLEELRREGKINLRKEKLRHKPKKFKIIVSL